MLALYNPDSRNLILTVSYYRADETLITLEHYPVATQVTQKPAPTENIVLDDRPAQWTRPADVPGRFDHSGAQITFSRDGTTGRVTCGGSRLTCTATDGTRYAVSGAVREQLLLDLAQQVC